MKPTPAQALVYKVVTAEPRSAKEIAEAAGRPTGQISAQLYALKAKGLIVKDLNPTRWRRA